MEDPRIDRAGEEETPDYPEPEDEKDDEGERQDTPPLPTTHEEVLQNLQHKEYDQNFLERDAHAKGIDYDDKQPTEPKLKE